LWFRLEDTHMNGFSTDLCGRYCAALIMLSALASCGGNNTDNVVASFTASSGLPGNTFTATLSNIQGGPVSGIAAGTGAVMVDSNARLLRAVLITTGINASAVQMRPVQSGLAGAILLPLIETSAGSGVWTASTSVTDIQLRALASGNHVFDVRSSVLTNGGTQGQIVKQSPNPAGIASGATPRAFTNTLTGAQQVPPSSSAATAVGVSLADPATRTLGAAVIAPGITGTATAVEIREAGPGANGPTVFPLAQTSAGSGIWFTKTILTDAQLNAVSAGNYYFVVATTAFPGGEIRGQIGRPEASGAAGLDTGFGVRPAGVGNPGTGTTGIPAGTGTGTPAAGATGSTMTPF
jgi:hypothetical protein